MISTDVKNEHISSEDLNTLLDKSSHVMIYGCRVDSGGYVSNMNAKVLVTNSRFKDNTIVLRDSEENKIETCIIDNGEVRGVSIIQGYAYTHQVMLTSRNGQPTQSGYFTISD